MDNTRDFKTIRASAKAALKALKLSPSAFNNTSDLDLKEMLVDQPQSVKDGVKDALHILTVTDCNYSMLR